MEPSAPGAVVVGGGSGAGAGAVLVEVLTVTVVVGGGPLVWLQAGAPAQTAAANSVARWNFIDAFSYAAALVLRAAPPAAARLGLVVGVSSIQRGTEALR
ncbi:hypothetical protein ACXPWS_15445 [Mycobacterium sp. BMJ-28]